MYPWGTNEYELLYACKNNQMDEFERLFSITALHPTELLNEAIQGKHNIEMIKRILCMLIPDDYKKVWHGKTLLMMVCCYEETDIDSIYKHLQILLTTINSNELVMNRLCKQYNEGIEERNEYKEKIKLFLRHSDVNQKVNGKTALSYLVKKKNVELVRWMIEEQHANPYIGHLLIECSTMNSTPYENESMLEYLLSLGLDVNKQDENGYTALMIAACEKNKTKLQLLFEYGALISFFAKDGMYVTERGNVMYQ